MESNEMRFSIWPTGVKYCCEFCDEGEMKFTSAIEASDALGGRRLFIHVCDKCGKELKLPKGYPYIDWEPLTSRTPVIDTPSFGNVAKMIIDHLDRQYQSDKNSPNMSVLKHFTEELVKRLDERYQPLKIDEE